MLAGRRDELDSMNKLEKAYRDAGYEASNDDFRAVLRAIIVGETFRLTTKPIIRGVRHVRRGG